LGTIATTKRAHQEDRNADEIVCERLPSAGTSHLMTPTQVESVIECVDLDAVVEFLVSEVGLRVDTISPADDPAEIALSGPGLAVRVRRSTRDSQTSR